MADTPFRKTVSFGWTPFRRALVLTAGLRLFYSVLAAIFSPFLTLNPHQIAVAFTENVMRREAHPWQYALMGVWQRFDTFFYIHIASHGYDAAEFTVFYPLYPTLIRLLSPVAGSQLAAAVLITTIATFFLIWGALRLLELDLTRRDAFRAVLLWMLWPDAFVFFTGYPDSMLLAFTVWSLYFARKGNWRAAGGTAFLAGLTKSLGCFTALPLIWIGWKQRDRRSIFAALAAAAGPALYQLWLHHSGFPSPSSVYQAHWHTAVAAPWTTAIDALQSLTRGGDGMLFLNVSALVCATVLSLSRRIALEYRIYSIAAILLFLTKRTDHVLESSVRYSLCALAAFPVLAQWLDDKLRFVGVTFFMAGLNLFLFRVYLDWGLTV